VTGIVGVFVDRSKTYAIAGLVLGALPCSLWLLRFVL